jgi:hypothetical protein
MQARPFDTIESAHEFVNLLREEVLSVEMEILEEICDPAADGAARRLDALRLVHYKLKQLDGHLGSSSRILNDLRALRRLLTAERRQPEPVAALSA